MATLWISIFLAKWNVQEREFTLQYGTQDISSIQSKTERRQFNLVTNFIRSVTNDSMNDKGVIMWHTYLWYALSVFITVMIFVINVAMSIAIFD
jgi:hypothetical protein